MSLSVGIVLSGDLWAGAEAQVLQLALQLRELGTTPHIALFHDGETAARFRAEALAVTCFDEQTLSSAALARGLRDWCETGQFDLVHTHGYKENILSAWALRGSGVKLVRTMHGLPHAPSAIRNLKRQAMHRLDMFVVRWGTDAMIAVSNDLATHLSPQIGSTSLKVIANGVSVPESLPTPETHPPRVGFFGRLVPVKAVDRLLRAFPAVRTTIADAECWIVGDGPQRSDLEALVAELGMGDAIRFLGFHEETAPLIAQVDVVALTSDHEGMPMISLEAGANARALLAPRVGGLPDVVEDGVTGVLLNYPSPETISKACIALLSDRDGTARMGTAARERIGTRYSAAQTARKTLALYEDVLSGNLATTRATASA